MAISVLLMVFNVLSVVLNAPYYLLVAAGCPYYLLVAAGSCWLAVAAGMMFGSARQAMLSMRPTRTVPTFRCLLVLRRAKRLCPPPASHFVRKSIAFALPSCLARPPLHEFALIAHPTMQHPSFQHEDDLIRLLAAVAKMSWHEGFGGSNSA